MSNRKPQVAFSDGKSGLGSVEPNVHFKTLKQSDEEKIADLLDEPAEPEKGPFTAFLYGLAIFALAYGATVYVQKSYFTEEEVKGDNWSPMSSFVKDPGRPSATTPQLQLEQIVSNLIRTKDWDVQKIHFLKRTWLSMSPQQRVVAIDQEWVTRFEQALDAQMGQASIVDVFTNEKVIRRQNALMDIKTLLNDAKKLRLAGISTAPVGAAPVKEPQTQTTQAVTAQSAAPEPEAESTQDIIAQINPKPEQEAEPVLEPQSTTSPEVIATNDPLQDLRTANPATESETVSEESSMALSVTEETPQHDNSSNTSEKSEPIMTASTDTKAATEPKPEVKAEVKPEFKAESKLKSGPGLKNMQVVANDSFSVDKRTGKIIAKKTVRKTPVVAEKKNDPPAVSQKPKFVAKAQTGANTKQLAKQKPLFSTIESAPAELAKSAQEKKKYYYVNGVVDFSNKGRLENVPTMAELNNLTVQLISAYEAGDLERFASFFDDDPESEYYEQLEQVKTEYQDLVYQTSDRQMFIRDMKWSFKDNVAIGKGTLTLVTLFSSQSQVLNRKKNLQMIARKDKNKILITRFE